MRTTGRIPKAVAALAVAASLAASPTPAYAETEAPSTGCVSNAEFSILAQGQRLSHIRTVAGDDAQVGMRYWRQGDQRYQERLYAMCTPSDSTRHTLTVRFMAYEGAWSAYLVDTFIGPED